MLSFVHVLQHYPNCVSDVLLEYILQTCAPAMQSAILPGSGFFTECRHMFNSFFEISWNLRTELLGFNHFDENHAEVPICHRILRQVKILKSNAVVTVFSANVFLQRIT